MEDNRDSPKLPAPKHAKLDHYQHSPPERCICYNWWIYTQFSSVQFSCSVSVWLFETPWTKAQQGSLSITNSWSLLKLTSIESMMPSNHLVICHPVLLPSILSSVRVFSMCQFFTSGGQSIRDSASASVLPMNVQDWFPLELTGLISWSCSLRDSQESSPTPPFKSNNSLVLSFLYSLILTSIYDYWKNHSFD